MNQESRSLSLCSWPITATVSLSTSTLGLRITVDERVIVKNIKLGIVVGGVNLGAGSVLVRSFERDVKEEWFAHTGKARGKHATDHRELMLELAHSESASNWVILVRVSSEGVAVRYSLPDLPGVAKLTSDLTSVDLSGFERAWVLGYQTWYETPRVGVDLSELADGDYGFPFLARSTEGDYLLMSESAIDGRYSGAHPVVRANANLIFEFADSVIEIARGDVTPWRIFMVGPLASIVESLFIDELAPAIRPELEDIDWIRPGRAAWSWWSDFYSGAQFEFQKRFVDAAAELSWEHLLIDCGWEETWVPEIVAYASQRGIQVHLWTVWHDLDGPEKLGKLELWRSWGVAGIKVDFMESESKDRYRWYDTVLQESARLGLMVNFHGSVIPRGWSRTWPHVIGYEAIRGSEYYVFFKDMPLTAEHNVIQPFTRNVAGAMDYTPVAFSAPGRVTSDGHELALSVVFECGITHFADHVDVYLGRPLVARFLAELAPSWDETLLLGGTPDTEAVLARRSGNRWFIGCIASGPARIVNVPLKRLGLKETTAWLITDAVGGRDLAEIFVSGETSLEISIAENGGFVAIITEAGSPTFRAHPRAAIEAPIVEPVLAELDENREVTLKTSPGAVVRVAPGWRAMADGTTHWRIRAPRDVEPGSLSVVTLEFGDRVPKNITHARIIAPLLPGVYRASQLPMLSFRNESGPVERNQSNGGGNPKDGNPMRIAGEYFEHGFGVSTPSSFQLYLGGRASSFSVSVGVDDETPSTRAQIIVRGDGRELITADVANGDAAHNLVVDVTGVDILTLSTCKFAEDDISAHVDWASAQLAVTSTASDFKPAPVTDDGAYERKGNT
jgi:hypothetical protein